MNFFNPKNVNFHFFFHLYENNSHLVNFSICNITYLTILKWHLTLETTVELKKKTSHEIYVMCVHFGTSMEHCINNV